MQLMTKEIEKSLPIMGSQDGEDNPTVYVKYFNPLGSWYWYGTEYNPEERLFFGLVFGFETEAGYFSLEELESIILPMGMGIERDLHFKPRPMAEVIVDMKKRGYEPPLIWTKAVAELEGEK